MGMSFREERALERLLKVAGKRLAAPPAAVDGLLWLLNETENVLSKVRQSPSQSMCTSLSPVMKGLVTKELLNHSDIDVKLAVTSCLSEILRITEPDMPYTDDTMKEIFQMIVKAFEKLDDIHSHSYCKRVSILETVAVVRLCVMMLDLECDALILEMFKCFLKTISPSHTGNIFYWMETIMTTVLQENNVVSSELLSCLLASMKKDNKDGLPIEQGLVQGLVEKVILNCAMKLKPDLVELVRSMGTHPSDYADIVSLVCQEKPEVPRKKDEVVEDDGWVLI